MSVVAFFSLAAFVVALIVFQNSEGDYTLALNWTLALLALHLVSLICAGFGL